MVSVGSCNSFSLDTTLTRQRKPPDRSRKQGKQLKKQTPPKNMNGFTKAPNDYPIIIPLIRDGSEYQIIRSRGSKLIFNIWTVNIFSHSNKHELTYGSNVGHFEGHYPAYTMVTCQRK